MCELENQSVADLEQVTEIFMDHRDELRRTVVRHMDTRLRSRVDPSDILQETLIEAIRAYPRYQETAPMPVFDWLRLLCKQTARNAYVFHVTTQKRSVKLETNNELLCERGRKQISSPSLVVSRQELVDRKAAYMEQLTPDEARVIRLRHQDQLGNDEIAARLGISKKAASKRYYRAVEKLSRMMALSAG